MIGNNLVMVPVKAYETAYEEALAQLEDGSAYHLKEWKWGYKEESANMEQHIMRIVYQFTFEPLETDNEPILTLRTIEVAGQY